MRPGLNNFKNWVVTDVAPGDHGWKITMTGPNGVTGAMHTGHIPIPEEVAKSLVGKRMRTLVMDLENTHVYFEDIPITVNALDYRMEYPGIEGIYNPQWPEEREAIGEMPPTLGEE